jgi:predicted transposase YbfD/YdcC
MVVSQQALASKENEIVVAPTVLQSLDLRGKVVTGDAMFTQQGLSEQLGSAGGDYLWIAKDNQP